MSKCPKCGKISEHPIKTWKIKQTTIALFECASCKAKWKSKITAESATPLPIVESIVPATTASPTTPIPKMEVKTPVETTVKNAIDKPLELNEPSIKNTSIGTVEITVKNPAMAPVEAAKPISGIRRFFASIFASQ